MASFVFEYRLSWLFVTSIVISIIIMTVPILILGWSWSIKTDVIQVQQRISPLDIFVNYLSILGNGQSHVIVNLR